MLIICISLLLSVVGSQAQAQNILNNNDHLKALDLVKRADAISLDIINIVRRTQKRDDCLSEINDVIGDYHKDAGGAAQLIQLSYQMENKSDEFREAGSSIYQRI
jgi:hypothetical protein